MQYTIRAGINDFFFFQVFTIKKQQLLRCCYAFSPFYLVNAYCLFFPAFALTGLLQVVGILVSTVFNVFAAAVLCTCLCGALLVTDALIAARLLLA